MYGLLYFIIFHKHHKRNKIELFELISLFTKFFALVTVSVFIIVYGIDCILTANKLSYDRTEVITNVTFGILVISVTIINFIFYVKRNLKDFDITLREANKIRTIEVGEVLELILLTIMFLMPLWRIPNFIKIFEDKKQLIINIIESFVISIASLIILFNLNPVNIKEKVNDIFNKNKVENLQKNEDENVEEKAGNKKVENEK